MQISFRTAVTEDKDELISLLVETIQSKCSKDYNLEEINAWCYSARKTEHWDSFVHNQFSIVAEINHKIVGFGSLENENCIYFLYVHKDYLGLGIASKIYEKLAQKSVDCGQRKITANVSKTALQFFEHKGFQVVRTNKNVISQVTIINYNMAKYH